MDLERYSNAGSDRFNCMYTMLLKTFEQLHIHDKRFTWLPLLCFWRCLPNLFHTFKSKFYLGDEFEPLEIFFNHDNRAGHTIILKLTAYLNKAHRGFER